MLYLQLEWAVPSEGVDMNVMEWTWCEKSQKVLKHEKLVPRKQKLWKINRCPEFLLSKLNFVLKIRKNVMNYIFSIKEALLYTAMKKVVAKSYE